VHDDSSSQVHVWYNAVCTTNCRVHLVTPLLLLHHSDHGKEHHIEVTHGTTPSTPFAPCVAWHNRHGQSVTQPQSAPVPFFLAWHDTCTSLSTAAYPDPPGGIHVLLTSLCLLLVPATIHQYTTAHQYTSTSADLKHHSLAVPNNLTALCCMAQHPSYIVKSRTTARPNGMCHIEEPSLKVKAS
jgi:hypothetical protein